MSDQPNVLLVILDSARAHNMSVYGYERDTTPFLSDFANRSTLYTQARSPSIHSIASHVSMFTGAHVEEHRAIRHTAQIDTTRTIWDELETEHGYTTGLFTNNRIVSNASNLGASFSDTHNPAYPLAERLENAIEDTPAQRLYFHFYDIYERLSERIRAQTANGSWIDSLTDTLSSGDSTSEPSKDGAGGAAPGYKAMHGGTFTDAFLEWEAEQAGPWAACLNLMDTHSPYQPRPEHDRWASDTDWESQREHKPSVWESLDGEGWGHIEALEALYDGTIRQADAILESLVNELDSRRTLDDSLVIITSDHGEAFGEHSRLLPDVRLRGHKWGIPEVLTHVPLLVSFPGQTEAQVVEDVVSLTDLPALMRSTVDGEEDPLPAAGPVLASTFRIPEEKISKYRSIDGLEDYIGPWRAVYENHDGTVRKFAQKDERFLTAEIQQSADVSILSREPHRRVLEAYDHLTEQEIVTEATSDIDDELESQLEDLGYIR